MDNQIIVLVSCCMLAVFMPYDMHAQEDVYGISVKNPIAEKTGSTNTFEINGKIPYRFANMTVMYPDGVYSATSSLSVKQDGTIQGFVFVDDTYTSGLYTVDVSSYDADRALKKFRTYFLLSDDEGLVEITVLRNAVFDCKDDDDGNDNDNNDNDNDNNDNDNDNNDAECLDPPQDAYPKIIWR